MDGPLQPRLPFQKSLPRHTVGCRADDLLKLGEASLEVPNVLSSKVHVATVLAAL